jgi:hypothetical protein
MPAIDREPGGSTMIRVSYEVKQLIEEEKIIPREPLNDCIKRTIFENRKYRTYKPSIETHEILQRDLEEFVLNPSIPVGGLNDEHRLVWNMNHPDDPILPDEIIHHINENHNDNRPENLTKIKKSEHLALHNKLRKEFLKSNNITPSNTFVGRDV